MFAIFKHCHPLPAHFLLVELWNSASARGCFILFLSGGNFCMRVVTCGCCVLYQLNLTGWEGGRGEQRAWTPSPPKKNSFWVRKCSSEEFVYDRLSRSHCTWIYVRMLNVLQGAGGHRTVHGWLAWTIAMSELCYCTTEWSFQFKQ